MRPRLLGVLISGSFCVSSVIAGDSKEQISLFKVPLRCPAAPQIGCGSHAKPILLELERDSSVSQAWLNRTGTTIAVVWKAESTVEGRKNVATKLKEWDATEIAEKSQESRPHTFSIEKGWYRAADVDRLSEEEANIIAARLVRRVQAKTTLAKDKADGLRQALAKMCEQQFTKASTRQKQEPVRLKDIAGAYLDEKQIQVLREEIESGVRPRQDEQ
jgi:hypothetical protein